jgi:hypothetical protein
MNPRYRFCAEGLLGAAVLTVSVGTGARADTVVLGASRDNTLYESSIGAWSNGVGANIFTGNAGDGDKHRAVIAFDIAGSLPANATIQGVTLTLHLSRTSSSTQTVTLHRVNTAWGEGASNAGGNEGGGAPAAPGDATWIHAFYDTILWAQPGGDFSAAVSASAEVTDLGFYSWSAPPMASDVQVWLDSPGENHGWLLLGNEGVFRTSKRFDSRENPDPAVRPVLVVDYTQDVPVEAKTWTSIKAQYR